MKAIIPVVAAATMLTGCEEPAPTQAEEAAYVNEQAASRVRDVINSDQQDIKATIAELQKKDPTVKDAYFTYNEKGEKQLHVVKEEANGGSSDSVFPLLAGVATGYLMASMMNSAGGYSNYSQNNRPSSSFAYQRDEDRRRAQSANTAASTTALMNSSRQTVRSSSNFSQNMRGAVMSSRSVGALSSTGARAASHSGGS